MSPAINSKPPAIWVYRFSQKLLWATGYNVTAIPPAAGVFYAWGVLITPALERC